MRGACTVVAIALAIAACAHGTSDDEPVGDDEPAPPVCGDRACDAGESAASCPMDCGAAAVCGDATCAPGENAASCPADCGSQPACGDGQCTAGGPLAESCSACAAAVCAVDLYCCLVEWDVSCVNAAYSSCDSSTWTCP